MQVNSYSLMLYYQVHVSMSQKLQVLTFLQSLPKGKVTTYKALAQKFGTHPRAIATYMRTNTQLDTYPCYKVVANDGGLSGYVLGREEKIHRLQEEGIGMCHTTQSVLEDYILRDL